jgi:hypothetical protein
MIKVNHIKIFKIFLMIACLFKKYPLKNFGRKGKKKTISFLRHLMLTYYILTTICLLTKYSFTNSIFSNKPSSLKRNNSSSKEKKLNNFNTLFSPCYSMQEIRNYPFRKEVKQKMHSLFSLKHPPFNFFKLFSKATMFLSHI